MKQFLRDREKQGKISRWTGAGISAGVHVVIFGALLLSGMTYLDPPPPSPVYFEMELEDIEQEEQKHPIPRGEVTTAEEADDSPETELVQRSESPIQADDKPNIASAGKSSDKGDVEVPTAKDAVENPNINFGALQRPDKSNTSDAAEDPSNQVVAGQSDGNVSAGKTDGSAHAKVAGHSAMSLGTPQIKTQQEGRVVVNITVDRHGNVRSASIDPGSQLILTQAQQNEILAKAKASRFTENHQAEELEKGTITYVFVVTQ